jgi:hypothetical protein
MVGFELVVQMLGVMVVDQHERFADRQSGIGGEDRRVLIRFAQLPNVKFVTGHGFSHPSSFYKTTCVNSTA